MKTPAAAQDWQLVNPTFLTSWKKSRSGEWLITKPRYDLGEREGKKPTKVDPFPDSSACEMTLLSLGSNISFLMNTWTVIEVSE